MGPWLSLSQVLVDTSCLMSRGLPVILGLLNGVPVTAIVDTRVELLTVSLYVMKWSGLPEIDYDSPLLVMKRAWKSTQVGWFGHRSNTRTILEHEFANMENAKHTVLLSNDSGRKAGCIVDQEGPSVYLKKEHEAGELATL